MKNKKLIIFGPWCGEFSYELSWWNPECRKLRNTKYKDYVAFHIGFEGRGVMYKDFVDKYIAYPKEIDETLIYPATYGEHDHVNGKDIIPQNLVDFVNYTINNYKKEFDIIEEHSPGSIPITRERCLNDYPFGEYIHYKIDNKIQDKVTKKLSKYFNNNRDTVAVMARIRARFRGRTNLKNWEMEIVKNGANDYLDWNPDNWYLFIEKLINELNLNVVMIGLNFDIENSPGRGGSITFENNKNIMSWTFEGEDSLEYQLALLKATTCSIYGATGAAVLPFFVNTSTFTQQTKEEGFRLTLGWEKDLTNNLKNVKIFDKYKNWEIWNSPVDELFEEFKQFYKEI